MKKQTNTWLFGIGVAIVILSHLYMLLYGMPVNMVAAHAWLNLVAAALLIIGWTNK